MVRKLNLSRCTSFFSTTKPSRPALEPSQLHIQWVPRSFPEGSAAEVWSLPLTCICAEVHNERKYASPPPIRLHGVHKDKFIFILKYSKYTQLHITRFWNLTSVYCTTNPTTLPIPVAVRSETWVCGRSLAEIMVSNPAGGQGCLSLVSVVRCQAQVSASAWSLVQRSLTECGVSECNLEASIIRRPWPTRGCCVNILSSADTDGRAVQGVSLTPLDCWDRRFESRWGHRCSSVFVFVACCVVSGL